jgi:hypothetical protein
MNADQTENHDSEEAGGLCLLQSLYPDPRLSAFIRG